MDRYVLDLQQVDRSQVALVGGKGAHLGELSRIDGIRVPAGFCVTTDAFRRIMADAPSIDDQLDRLARLKPDDRAAIRAASAEVRRTLEAIPSPTILLPRSRDHLRGSATEPPRRPIQRHGGGLTHGILRGSARLVSERRGAGGDPRARQPVLGLALHRARRDLSPAERHDHRKVHMAVVVQQMVFSRAAGVLFTADPITGNRRVASVDAISGLGEALVSAW